VRPVIVEYDTEAFSGRVLVSNITAEGLFVETVEFFTTGQKVDLTVSDINGKDSVTTNAKVARITPRGAALRFDNLTQEQKEKLESLLKHLAV
jgi:Tfp pilus assembly protein PilZ